MTYDVHLMDVSYFSGKLEAYLRYKRIPYRRCETTWLDLQRTLLPNTGLAKVPVVRTPEGQWLQDTTPILDWMEARHPEGAVLPENPVLAVLARILEDYADEWLWRPALHFRWSFGPDRRLLGDRIAREVMRGMPLPPALRARWIRRRQHREYVRGDGVSPATRAHVESIYFETLRRLEAHLASHDFLHGPRPGLADFGFFASMFRHFSLDPTPARIMRDEAPGVYAWVARLWNARWDRLPAAGPGPEGIPGAWGDLLRDAATGYLPYLHANALAWRDGAARFDLSIQGVPYRNLPTVQYRVWCRERLQDHVESVPEPARAPLFAILEETGVSEPLFRDGRIPSGLHEGAAPPLCDPARPSLLDRVASRSGSVWNRAAAARRLAAKGIR